ncbi:hypothetical protein QSH46_012085 [Xanthomonas arboricola pv. juglandis]|uniref:hypothetical protein n=1 Tax=Xanthomonas TaxID=338 RepID=UPI0011B05C17|nr:MULTISPECIES: hypothetical protein [Xanthomonas]MEB1610600.1 hypothetical protein [Xanthomonas campestris pv. campestris]MDN0220575.1 hypothetical protein [Xanthomonas arboricola pv. juglandis]MDN0224969.1 hypothetical protein [Xanthomonas arboricola pv. juglandis]MDN0229183.1 hypothetical protein [Xanthomonas arboricola pv. juglandis]MDN0233484.1 hypothetical protein [Xanthomonas arboricola pv. juglandis]
MRTKIQQRRMRPIVGSTGRFFSIGVPTHAAKVMPNGYVLMAGVGYLRCVDVRAVMAEMVCATSVPDSVAAVIVRR